MLRPMVLLRWPLAILAITALVGCQGEAEPEPPGVNGRLTLRVWEAGNRDGAAPPTVMTADLVRQEGVDFDDLTMEPVTIRRPLTSGVVWILSPRGRQQRQSGAPAITLDPPIHLSGVVNGVPLVGTAASCQAAPGGRSLVLTDVVLAQDGLITTAPQVTVGEGQAQFSGESMVSGAAAVGTALAALPDPLHLSTTRNR